MAIGIAEASVIIAGIGAGTGMLLKYVPGKNGKCSGVPENLCDERMTVLRRALEKNEVHYENLIEKVNEILVEIKRK